MTRVDRALGALAARDQGHFDAKWTPDPNSGCWLWVGTTNATGYGVLWVREGSGRAMILAHKVSFALTHGRAPVGHLMHKYGVGERRNGKFFAKVAGRCGPYLGTFNTVEEAAAVAAAERDRILGPQEAFA